MSSLLARPWLHLPVVLAMASFLAGNGVTAQTYKNVASPESMKEERSAETADDWGADERVRKMIAEWKRTDSSARRLFERDDISIVEGVASTNLRTEEKRWGKSRSLAYTKAFVDAMNAYVARTRTRFTNNLIRKYFQEDIDESALTYRPGESSDDMVSRIAAKALTLAGHKLDKALAEAGMSTAEIESLTPPQKKVAFSDRLSLSATVEAVGSAHGLVTFKTFEAVDAEGNAAIGVVAVGSARMRNLAKRIVARKAIRPDADKAQTAIADQIFALSDENLIREFGPRVWWDQNGYPTVVAFGQWAWSPEGLTKRKRARRRAFAMEQAKSNAMFHLAMFLDVATRFSKDSVVGEEAEEFHRIFRDGTVSDEETASITDTINKSSRARSTVGLAGLKVWREWFGRHPDADHHEIVGVVVSWSPAQEDQVRAELGKKAKHRPSAKKTVRKRSGSTAQSRNLMDPADF